MNVLLKSPTNEQSLMNWLAFAETKADPPNYPPLWIIYIAACIATTVVPTEAELFAAEETVAFFYKSGTLSPMKSHFKVVLSGNMMQV